LAFYFHDTEKPKQITDHQLETLIKTVSMNTKLIDANTDHNQALDVMQYAKKNNIEIPRIIVNFDTHSDIYLNDHGTFPDSGVEDWLNEYIAQNPNVDTLYWVMPNEEAKNIPMQILMALKIFDIPKEFSPLLGNSIAKMNPFYFVVNPIYKKNFSQDFLIDPKTKTMNEYIEGHKLNKKLFKNNIKYKKVKIITCSKDTLPDFKGEKVFLSLDSDYMSNSGFDTALDFKFIKSDQGILSTFYSVFETVKNKNMKPVIISMSLSPQYLPKSKHNYVNGLLKKTIEYSKKQDIITDYKHHYNPKRYE
jgi:hypothetical protein